MRDSQDYGDIITCNCCETEVQRGCVVYGNCPNCEDVISQLKSAFDLCVKTNKVGDRYTVEYYTLLEDGDYSPTETINHVKLCQLDMANIDYTFFE
jgi:hypothetical protein